jgi:hypothetical protein
VRQEPQRRLARAGLREQLDALCIRRPRPRVAPALLGVDARELGVGGERGGARAGVLLEHAGAASPPRRGRADRPSARPAVTISAQAYSAAARTPASRRPGSRRGTTRRTSRARRRAGGGEQEEALLDPRLAAYCVNSA